MHWFCIVIIVVATSVVASPNRRRLLNLVEGDKYSDDVLEDASLDAPELILKYGYPSEVHEVETEDGYILQMHRIPHGRDANNDPDADRPVAFVQHGLFSSSADWVDMGPGAALGYLLAEEGYDVWLGNARGNYYSRKHRKYDPDGLLSRQSFWKFSWEEIGLFDLPAMIDYALQTTAKSELHYIGHSQGTTTFFVMASLRPAYNKKIISMQALAPVAFIGNIDSVLVRAIAPFATSIQKTTSLIGINEFLPNTKIMTLIGSLFCKDQVVTQVVCKNILFLAGGRNEVLLNTTKIPIILGHAPAGASSRQLVHYGQGVVSHKFRRYDHGWLQNLSKYGRTSPPDFPLHKITAPVFLHYSQTDYLATPKDVRILSKSIAGAVEYKVPMKEFTHIDFLWAINAKELVWNRTVRLMKKMDSKKRKSSDDDNYSFDVLR